MKGEEMPYESPEWLRKNVGVLNELGFTTGDSHEFGSHYAQQTDSVAAEYFALTLSDPGKAIESMPDYLARFKAINSDPCYDTIILTSTTPEQFGLIVNIASLQYEGFDQDERENVLAKVCDFLGRKNCMNVPGYTVEIRNPELVRDLVGHWSRIYSPWLDNYSSFVGNAEWEDVIQSLEDHRNNPTMFAMAIPYATTPAPIRERFQAAYPVLSKQGIDIIAASSLCEGAHDEILSEEFPDSYRRSWEESVYKRLDEYGEEYRDQILESIATRPLHLFDNDAISVNKLLSKMRSTQFLLSDSGELVRFQSI